jgi:hypothetical protein
MPVEQMLQDYQLSAHTASVLVHRNCPGMYDDRFGSFGRRQPTHGPVLARQAPPQKADQVRAPA